MPKKAKCLAWLALGALLTASGCAKGRYQGSYYYPPRPYVYSEPYYDSDVPPSFYNNDPNLRQWYTSPYWNPEAP